MEGFRKTSFQTQINCPKLFDISTKVNEVKNFQFRVAPASPTPLNPSIDMIWRRYVAMLGPAGLAAAGLLPGR